ncbi:hypothetical protein [Arthrobacter sp. NPDC056727]|uniref:hypothetical protein n=1 Tax=Arthrobacter sp. NPDC056727 TaxID=3345927 RepID=UPI00366EC46F
MKTHTRRAAAVAGIAILVGAASSGAIAAQGQTEQQFTHDAVILISANSSDQHHRGDRTTDHHRTQRADWSERNGSTHSRNGKNGTAATAGVEAAAAVDARAGTEVVLKSLPGVESAGVDSAAESCS